MGDRLRIAEFWHQIRADLGVSDLVSCLDRFLDEIEGLWSVRLNDIVRSKGRRASGAGHTASFSLHSHRTGHEKQFFHHLKISVNFYQRPKKWSKTDEKPRFGGTLPCSPSQRSLPTCRALPIIFGKRHPCWTRVCLLIVTTHMPRIQHLWVGRRQFYKKKQDMASLPKNC